jgi:hypothetical protein
MTDLLSMLKRCISALDIEISTIDSGRADQLLQYYGSYAVPDEFVDACAGNEQIDEQKKQNITYL